MISASAGPYLVAAMGFAVLLGSAGLSTLRSGVLPRWTGIVALIGAVAFLVTFLTLIAGTGKDSVFGYGYLPGVLALVIWSVATSIASYRGTSTARSDTAGSPLVVSPRRWQRTQPGRRPGGPSACAAASLAGTRRSHRAHPLGVMSPRDRRR